MPIKRHRLGVLTVLVHEGGKVSLTHGSVRFAWRGSVTEALEAALEAVTEPEMFVEHIMGKATGREAIRRGKSVEAAMKAARRLGYEHIERAVEIARDKGML